MRTLLLLTVVVLSATNGIRSPYYVPSIEGQWVGQITQNDGGYLPNYSYELFFQVDKGRIHGRSYVRAPGVEGVMRFTVERRGEVFYLEEKELLESRKPRDLSWCFKRMQLRFVRRGSELVPGRPLAGSIRIWRMHTRLADT